MKKRILILALAAIMVGCAIGGTMAYYTNQATATNVITAGNIRAELREWADLENKIPYADPEEPIMPGEDVAKIVTVRNTGASYAWIRVKVDVGITKADGTAGDPALIEIVDYNTRDWTQKDGWWYYNKSAAPGAETEVLFTKVRFNTAMDNPYQNCKVSVDVSAQAVQTANNGASAPEAAGWPEE